MSVPAATFCIFLPLLVALAALFAWVHWFRPAIGEPPVKESMLRSAGESSLRKIAELNEKLLEDIVFAVAVPLMLALSYFQSQARHGNEIGAGWLMLTAISFAAVFWKGRVFAHRLTELRNRELGCAGERLVAERLSALAQHGCLIFHDCPADHHGNIDHIVITPSAVYAIETKTRRKRPSSDPARSPAEVIYNGSTLEYPHGREDFGLNQARRQAKWLSELLGRALAEPVAVKPVLALPGWMVSRKGRGDVAVVNPKELPALIRESSASPATPAAIRRMRQIAFVLDGRCRDVAFGGGRDAATTEAGKTTKPAQRTRHRYAATAR